MKCFLRHRFLKKCGEIPRTPSKTRGGFDLPLILSTRSWLAPLTSSHQCPPYTNPLGPALQKLISFLFLVFSWLFLLLFVLNVPSTAKVIWRRGQDISLIRQTGEARKPTTASPHGDFRQLLHHICPVRQVDSSSTVSPL